MRIWGIQEYDGQNDSHHSPHTPHVPHGHNENGRTERVNIEVSLQWKMMTVKSAALEEREHRKTEFGTPRAERTTHSCTNNMCSEHASQTEGLVPPRDQHQQQRYPKEHLACLFPIFLQY
jgi:hypothetical protein